MSSLSSFRTYVVFHDNARLLTLRRRNKEHTFPKGSQRRADLKEQLFMIIWKQFGLILTREANGMFYLAATSDLRGVKIPFEGVVVDHIRSVETKQYNAVFLHISAERLELVVLAQHRGQVNRKRRAHGYPCIVKNCEALSIFVHQRKADWLLSIVRNLLSQR